MRHIEDSKKIRLSVTLNYSRLMSVFIKKFANSGPVIPSAPPSIPLIDPIIKAMKFRLSRIGFSLLSNLFGSHKLLKYKTVSISKSLPPPVKGNVRLTFLVSDRLYMREGDLKTIAQDSLSGPVFQKATELLTRITSTH